MSYQLYKIKLQEEETYRKLYSLEDEIKRCKRKDLIKDYKADAIKLLEELIKFKESYGVDTQGDKNEIINFTNM